MALKIEKVEVFGVAMPLMGHLYQRRYFQAGHQMRGDPADGIGWHGGDQQYRAIRCGQVAGKTAAELLVALRDRLAAAVIGQDPTNINRMD